MPSVATLQKLNAASGLFFGVFLVIHLICHYTLNLSFEDGQRRLQTMRAIYQHPVFEILLATSLFVHFFANINLYLDRNKINSSTKKRPIEGSLELQGHRIAGYILSIMIVGHVIATRIGPLIVLDDPRSYDYSFIALAISLIPFKISNLFLILFGCAGGWHLIYGTRAAITTLSGGSVHGKKFPIPLKMLALTNHLLIIGAVLALSTAATTLVMNDEHVLLLQKYGLYYR